MWAVITQKNVSYVVESAEYFGTTWWFKRARWRLSLKTWTCTVLFALAIDYFRITHNALCLPPKKKNCISYCLQLESFQKHLKTNAGFENKEYEHTPGIEWVNGVNWLHFSDYLHIDKRKTKGLSTYLPRPWLQGRASLFLLPHKHEQA